MERRKKPMKSPFVVTISVAAVAAASLAAVACGGKVPSDGVGSSGSSGTSGTSGSSGVIGNPPAPTSCTSETKAGDPCSTAYGSGECFSGVNGAALFCEGNVWIEQPIEISNPPPPPPQCPDQAPVEGSACSYVPDTCSYVDGCSARPPSAPADKTFVCNGGAWKRSSPSYTAVCPADFPSPGSSCATCAGSYPADCTYPANGSGCPGPTAVCNPTTLTWSVVIASCNPPALDAGAGP